MSPIKNWPPLWAALEYIDENPHEYDQQFWRCGSVACVAGWVALLDTDRWADTTAESELLMAKKAIDAGVPNNIGDMEDGLYHRLMSSDQLVSISRAACMSLGIEDGFDEDINERLFNGDRSWREIMSQVAVWATEDGVAIPDRITTMMIKLFGPDWADRAAESVKGVIADALDR